MFTCLFSNHLHPQSPALIPVLSVLRVMISLNGFVILVHLVARKSTRFWRGVRLSPSKSTEHLAIQSKSSLMKLKLI